MCAMTVIKLQLRVGRATAAARPMGAFSTGVPVDWGLSQRPARVDCGLSYTTGQVTSSSSYYYSLHQKTAHKSKMK